MRRFIRGEIPIFEPDLVEIIEANVLQDSSRSEGRPVSPRPTNIDVRNGIFSAHLQIVDYHAGMDLSQIGVLRKDDLGRASALDDVAV